MSDGFGPARLLALILGAAALGGVLVPALVAGAPGSVAASGPTTATLAWGAKVAPAGPAQRAAVALLQRAAAAGKKQAYSGTQTLSSWSAAGDSSVMVDLQHAPGHAVRVRLSGGPASSAVNDPGGATLDAVALALLERHYRLSVTAEPGRCVGRPAHILEARSLDTGAVAGRFWLDGATGLVLRRDLFDRTGRRVRMAAFVELSMSAGKPWPGPTRGAAAAESPPLDARQQADLRRAGWATPGRLGAMELFDVRTGHGVLHLSYTDGLFAVSVFSQRGRLDRASVAGWQRATMAGTPAWTRPGLSRRVVWAGHGWVHTAVADAPDAMVSAVVGAFPAAGPEGFGHRVVRGLQRMGSWVDPTG